MKSQLFLASLIAGALIMSGCNTGTPTPMTNTDQPSTQAHQETTASIAVVNDDNSAETVSGDQVYQDYTAARKAALHGSKPYVLFFHANWCPICRVMESSITAELDTFPVGTNILKANYDTEKALKDEFGIRVQSTIVVLDAGGEVVWKGQDPAMDDLKQYITDSLS